MFVICTLPTITEMAGCLFKRGEVYFNEQTQEYHLSLGFMAYGCLTISARRHEDH